MLVWCVPDLAILLVQQPGFGQQALAICGKNGLCQIDRASAIRYFAQQFRARHRYGDATRSMGDFDIPHAPGFERYCDPLGRRRPEIARIAWWKIIEGQLNCPGQPLLSRAKIAVGMEILGRHMASCQTNDCAIADRKTRLGVVLRDLETGHAMERLGQAHADTFDLVIWGKVMLQLF